MPRPIAEVIDRALAFERDDRYPDALAMQTALRAAYETMQSAPLSTAPRLDVPEVAMQRTIPSAGAIVPEGRTANPVVAGRTGVPVAQRATAPLLLALVAAALLVGGLAVTAMVILRGDAPKTEPSSAVSPSPTQPTPTQPAAPAASSAPTVTVAPAPTASAAPSVTQAVAGPTGGSDKTKSKAPTSAPKPAVPDDPFLGGRHK